MTSSLATTSGSVLVPEPWIGGGDLFRSPPSARTGFESAVALRWLRTAIYVACSAFVWLIVWLSVWVMIPMVLGFEPRVVQTGSMSGAIDRGDVVLVQDPVPQEMLAPGTILTFDLPDFGDVVVTHRIVEVDAAGAIWTKGDANATRDSMPVPRENIHGMARLLVPAIGLPSVWLAEGRVWLVVVLALAAAVSAAVAFGWRDPFPFASEPGHH